MKRKILVGLLALLLAICSLCLVACGGGEQSGTQGGNNPPPQVDTGNENLPPAETYSATFNANGGTFEDDSQTLILSDLENNALLTAPTSPTRDGYNFIGWAMELDGTEQWDFSTNKITEDIILYAIWEQKIIEREVTYIHNYAGVEDFVQSTVDGLITYVPVRSGYVFNGWWLSDGQTATGEYILTQKWDTSEIVLEDDLVLYAEWIEESTLSSQLSAPSVSISQNVFSWNAVTNATGYNVQVFFANERVSGETITETSWTFPSSYDAGYYTIKIRATGDGVNTVNSVFTSKNYGHNILAVISKIDFDISTSVLTWSPVKNATSYELYIDGQLVDTLSYASYDMSDYEAGAHIIHIVAKRNNYQSSSVTETITKSRLKTPVIDNLYIEKNTGKYVLAWDSVAYSDTYILNVNGSEIKVSDANLYKFDNDATFWNGLNQLTVTISAFDSNADYLMSIATEEIKLSKFYKLTIDKNIDEGEVTASGVFYAPQTVTVSFDLNGASGTISSQSITGTNGIKYPSIPSRTGYVFRGWFTDNDCTEIYDFTKTIDEDITLYAGWHQIQTTGYGNYVIDITSSCNSSSNYYSSSMSRTSSSNAKYVYFTALTTGTYNLYCKNEYSSSNYGTYIYVYNATTGTTIQSNSLITSTSYSSISMSLNAGDVIYIRNYRYTSGYYANFYLYITGATMPSDGGLADTTYLVKGNNTFGAQESCDIEYNAEMTVTTELVSDYQFMGWYNGDELLSEDLSYTFNMPASDITYTAKFKTVPELSNFYFTATSTTYTITGLKDTTLTEITIPNIVTSIGEGAFRGCSSLTSITIPDGVTSIYYSAFSGCQIENATIPTIAIGYIKNSKLKTVVITSGDNIGSNAFEGCSSLTSITIPDSVTSIGSYAFVGCSSLTSITIPDGVTSIGDSAFSGCSSLTSITIPDGVTSIGDYAFRNCSSLTSITIPDGVTSIGSYAFQSCSSLTSITIPDSVTSISKYAFEGCSSLTSITIPDGVTSIGSYAFQSCSSLTSITIPDGVTSIGYSAFEDCSSLTSITIPDSVTSIDYEAFVGCSSLTSINVDVNNANYCSQDGVLYNKDKTSLICYPAGKSGDFTIPDGVTSIGSYAFQSCSSLTSITIPDGVTSIGSYAFRNCQIENATIPTIAIGYIKNSKLKTVVITSGDNIGSNAFGGCSSLTSITIPDGVTSIGERAFRGCSSLTSITIPDGVTSIGYSAFSGCSSLTSITIPDSVTSIGNYAFGGCSSLTSITIPDGVTSIGERAFRGCSSLTSITIPDGVTSIGYSAFSGCSSLTSITIPDSVTSIGNYAFEDCSSLTSITIPDSVTSIGNTAFYGCSSLTSITIPDSVTSIDEEAFYNCNKLVEVIDKSDLNITKGSTANGYIGYYALQVITDEADSKIIYKDDYIFYNDNGNYYLLSYKGTDTNLVLPDNINGNTYSIYNTAFDGCSSLTSITIPDSVTSIGYSAFEDCSSLTSITIPDSVTSIGNYAFRYCNKITSVTIGDSVTSIGYSAFSGCSSLTSITIPDGVTSIGSYAFQSCSSLTSITIPDSVTSISKYAFEGCSSLTSITIPDGVTSIGERAFRGCSSLTSITIPDGVTSISKYAFEDCDSLTSVYYKGSEADKANISIDDSYNSSLTNATWYYYSEYQPTGSGNYWRYVDGVPTVW